MKRTRLLLFLACYIFGFPFVSAQIAVFVEKFDDQDNKWALVQGRKITSVIEEGVLEIKTTSKSEGNFILLPMPISQQLDFDLELTLTQTGGAKNMAYGLCWAAKDDQSDFMGFFLSSNGKYTLLSRNQGMFKEVKRWTESKLVNGPRRPNQIKVSRRGDLYIYYLNGKRVFASKAPRVTGDQMGIALYGKMKLQVDNFILTDPRPIPDEQKEVLRVKAHGNQKP